MNILKIVLLLTAFTISGCIPESTLVESVDMGHVVDIELNSTSFNESIKSTIRTDKGAFIIIGMPSALIGSRVTLDRYDDGRSYVCVAGWTSCRRVWF